jgi:hypothetical protein
MFAGMVGDFFLEATRYVTSLVQKSLKFPYLVHIFPSTPPCKLHRLTNQPNGVANFLAANAIPS